MVPMSTLPSCWSPLAASPSWRVTAAAGPSSYAILIALILIVNISVAALAGPLQSRIGSGAQQSWQALQENYFVSIGTYVSTNRTQQDNLAARAAVTRLINLVHVSFDCCGATEVNDVNRSSSWLSSDRKWWRGGFLVNPLTCCQLKSPDYKRTILSPAFNWSTIDAYLMDYLCPFKEHSASLHNKVCPGSLVDYTGNFTNPMLGFSIAMALLLTLGLFVCCWFGITMADVDMDSRPDSPVQRQRSTVNGRRDTPSRRPAVSGVPRAPVFATGASVEPLRPVTPSRRPAVSGVPRAPVIAMNANGMDSRTDSPVQRQRSTVNGRRDTPSTRPAVPGVPRAPVFATGASAEPLRPVKVSPQTR